LQEIERKVLEADAEGIRSRIRSFDENEEKNAIIVENVADLDHQEETRRTARLGALSSEMKHISMAILFAALSRTAAFADDSTLNADICSMREKITANPATLSTSLRKVESNIDTVSDLKTKGPLLAGICAARLVADKLSRPPEPDVLRLANQGMAFPHWKSKIIM